MPSMFKLHNSVKNETRLSGGTTASLPRYLSGNSREAGSMISRWCPQRHRGESVLSNDSHALDQRAARFGDMGDEHVPCVLPQIPWTRSQNLIFPQTLHEAHIPATRLVCAVVVSIFLPQHEFDGPGTDTTSMTVPYMMCVGISFKTWGKYLYTTPHDTRSLKVACSYSSTLPPMRDGQKRLITHGLLFSRTLERYALFQVRVFCCR